MDNISAVKNSFSQIIEKSLEAKKYFVEKDMYDMNERMILNFGHTIGHVIEKQFGYGNITHGQAVAEGMFVISEFAYKNNLVKTNISKLIRATLDKFDFRDDIVLDIDFILNVIKNDKKTFNETINLILIEDFNKPIIKKLNIEYFLDSLKEYLV